MLDFYFIADNQPNNPRANRLEYAGGIEYEEFVKAQELKIIETHLDYYGKFRWISQNVQLKQKMLTSDIAAVVPNLGSILNQAFFGEWGLLALGD